MTTNLLSPPLDVSNRSRSSNGEFAKESHTPGAMELVPDAAADTVFTKTYGTPQEKTDAIHAELARSVEALASDEKWMEYLDVMSSFHKYSMSNQIMINIQCPDATIVAGTKHWNSLGRYVNAGAKGITIFRAPSMYQAKDAETGEKLVGADGEPVMRKSWGTVPVFDVSQTNGRPLPESHTELTEEPPAGFIDDLQATIAGLGFTVVYQDIPGSKGGWTDGLTKEVVVDASVSPADRARTLAHELGHIQLGHLDEMENYHSGHDGKRGFMEVEAESVAYVICRNAGMTPAIGNTSSTYVAGWAKGDKKILDKTASNVAKAVKAVLETVPFLERQATADATADALNAVAGAEWDAGEPERKAAREAGWAERKELRAAAKAAAPARTAAPRKKKAAVKTR